MIARALLVLAVGLLPADDAPKDDAVKKEKEKLKGTWKGGEGKREAVIVITDDSMTVTFKRGDKDRVYKGTYKLDPTQKPKALDFLVNEGPDEHKGKTSLQIYELDGDKLKWCANEPGKEGRPKEFAAQGGYLLIEFMREKP
jgi:uncharacterized protein (TIGR03067 family)